MTLPPRRPFFPAVRARRVHPPSRQATLPPQVESIDVTKIGAYVSTGPQMDREFVTKIGAYTPVGPIMDRVFVTKVVAYVVTGPGGRRARTVMVLT